MRCLPGGPWLPLLLAPSALPTAARAEDPYFGKARQFEAHGKDYTPEGFSVSLSGPSAGVSFGVRL